MEKAPIIPPLLVNDKIVSNLVGKANVSNFPWTLKHLLKQLIG